VVKFLAYHLTGSTAVLSDPESIVNVVAALFAIGSLCLLGARRSQHPYGHGKLSILRRIRRGLIALRRSYHLRGCTGFFEPLSFGSLISTGDYLWRCGQCVLGGSCFAPEKPPIAHLIADGKHVLSDPGTSLGVIVGLLLVRLTGIAWFDPLVAAIVGVNLGGPVSCWYGTPLAAC